MSFFATYVKKIEHGFDTPPLLNNAVLEKRYIPYCWVGKHSNYATISFCHYILWKKLLVKDLI